MPAFCVYDDGRLESGYNDGFDDFTELKRFKGNPRFDRLMATQKR